MKATALSLETESFEPVLLDSTYAFLAAAYSVFTGCIASIVLLAVKEAAFILPHEQTYGRV